MSSSTLTVLFLVVFSVGYLNATNLQLGSQTSKVAFSQIVQKDADPLTPKVESYIMYKDSTKIIKGICATDLDQTDARVTVTAGGIGLSFVKLLLKSSTGHGLNYKVEIFI